MKIMTTSIRLMTIFLICLFLATQVTAGKKKKGTNRSAAEKTVTGKVSVKKDRPKFTVSYKIGGLIVGRSVKDKVEEFKGKTVKAECRIHRGIIVQIHKIEETSKEKKKKK